MTIKKDITTTLLLSTLFNFVPKANAINFHGIEPIHNEGIGFFASTERRNHTIPYDMSLLLLTLTIMSLSLVAYVVHLEPNNSSNYSNGEDSDPDPLSIDGLNSMAI